MRRTGSGKWDKILAVGGTAAIFFCLIFLWVYVQGTKKEPEDAPDPVTITLVYAYQNAQWNQGIQTIAEEFNKTHADIAVDVQVQYEDKVYEDILAKLQARGEMGDVIQIKTPGRYTKEGLLAPIPAELTGLLDETYRYEGEDYGLLAVGHTNGILYNRDIFERCGLTKPQTYGEFLQICETLSDHGVTPVGVAGAELWHLEFWVNHFFRNDVLSENENWLADCGAGKVRWQDEGPVRMLSHLQQLLTSGYVNEDWPVKQDGNLAYSMSQGEVAMIYTGSWTALEVQKLNPSLSLGWFFVPDEGGNVIVSENKDVYWCITKQCGEDEARYRAACEFLGYFYSDDVYTSLCESIYAFPVTAEKAVIARDEIQLEMKEGFSGDQRHMSFYIGDDNTPQGFETALLTEIVALGERRRTVAEVAVRLDELWEKYREQER